MIMLLNVFTSLFLFCEIGLTVIEATMESPFKTKFELKRSIDKKLRDSRAKSAGEMVIVIRYETEEAMRIIFGIGWGRR